MTIEVRGLEKSFGVNKVVDDVSFEVGAGELVALLGPSGGGKSTVLRILAGLETPDKGDVVLDGVAVTHKKAQERSVGFVFQHYALFRHMTVRENVAFGLEVRKRPRAEIDRTVDELLGLVQLASMGHRYPSELSGGQRQRVALARALAPMPRIVLLDEPFSALDAKVRVELRQWIRRLHHERGVTSVFVTHDQEEAMELADRVVVLNRGKVEQIGTPVEIYDKPATAFVASFVGSINVLEGAVQRGRAALGTLGVDAPGAGDGATVRAFVRPHDVVLSRSEPPAASTDPAQEGPTFGTARVERLSRVGWTVKVELRLSDGQSLAVELTKEQARELDLAEGAWVTVNLREAKIFVEDYAI